MKTEKIIIANLKCSGCANTIKSKLSALAGVQNVSVVEEQDLVIVEHDEKSQREDFTHKLRDLGYPEATEENGLLLKLKSYASCVVGRMDNMVN